MLFHGQYARCTFIILHERSHFQQELCMTIRLTSIAETLPDQQVRCGICQWRCELAPEQVGRCLVRAATPDGIVALADGLASAATVSAIEDHRLWHFFPATPVLSIGSWGYAFPQDQQRGQYARIPEDETKRRNLEPDRVANVALERLCRGVVWTYSEPAVAHEYVTDLMRTCRASSRYTALVTTGYMTIEALDQFGLYLDGMQIEIRAFDDAAYRRLAGIDHWRGILEVAQHAHDRWHCEIEITTRMHPGVNDSVEQIQGLASWIQQAIGPKTPWHVLAGDAGTAAASSVARARKIAREVGLQYVYGPDANQSTFCANCGSTLIERKNSTRIVGLEGAYCTTCGSASGIRTSIFKQH
jgi:pyruvate formate lyase activating enzyme